MMIYHEDTKALRTDNDLSELFAKYKHAIESLIASSCSHNFINFVPQCLCGFSFSNLERQS